MVLSYGIVAGPIRAGARLVDTEELGRLDVIAAIVGAGGRKAAALDRAEDGRLADAGLAGCFAEA